MYPAYFTEKVNLFVALAPISRMQGIKVQAFQDFQPHWNFIKILAEEMHYFNPLGTSTPDLNQERVLRLICKLFPRICQISISTLSTEDTTIDNFDRLNDFLKVFPSGSCYRDIILSLQLMGSDSFV